MRAKSWMPMYWGDYLADTGHLNATQHGAYLLLIAHYWNNGSIPINDDERLARICRIDIGNWRRHCRGPILEFFDVGGGHPRLDREIAKAKEISNKRKDAAKKMHSLRDASAEQKQPQPQPQPQPLRKKELRAVASATRTEVESEFEKLKAVYPKRDGAQGWKPSAALFESAIKRGWAPADIIAAARKYRDECERKGITGTDKVAQCLTWLRQERFAEYKAPPAEETKISDEFMRAKGFAWDGEKWAKLEAQK